MYIFAFKVERNLLPQNKPQALSPEEMAKRRELAKLRIAAKLAATPLEEETNTAPPTSEPFQPELSEDVFIAFARVYSGCLKPGASVYVLGPKHDPADVLKMVLVFIIPFVLNDCLLF